MIANLGLNDRLDVPGITLEASSVFQDVPPAQLLAAFWWWICASTIIRPRQMSALVASLTVVTCLSLKTAPHRLETSYSGCMTTEE